MPYMDNYYCTLRFFCVQPASKNFGGQASNPAADEHGKCSISHQEGQTDDRSKVMMARAGASTVVRSRCDAGREMRGNLRV